MPPKIPSILLTDFSLTQSVSQLFLLTRNPQTLPSPSSLQKSHARHALEGDRGVHPDDMKSAPPQPCCESTGIFTIRCSMYKRFLQLPVHPENSFFLWGPRQAGKNPDHEAILGRGDQVDLEGAPAL